MIRALNPRERSNATSVTDKSPGTKVTSANNVSFALGCAVLFIKEGLLVGCADESDVGLTVGSAVEGETVGVLVGFKVGFKVGSLVDDMVGDGTSGARSASEEFLFC